MGDDDTYFIAAFWKECRHQYLYLPSLYSQNGNYLLCVYRIFLARSVLSLCFFFGKKSYYLTFYFIGEALGRNIFLISFWRKNWWLRFYFQNFLVCIRENANLHVESWKKANNIMNVLSAVDNKLTFFCKLLVWKRNDLIINNLDWDKIGLTAYSCYLRYFSIH